MNSSRLKLSAILIALPLAIGLYGCNKDEKTPASQVAAKVNSSEISVHQINFLLSRLGPAAAAATPEQAKKLRQDVLEKLIEQQLAVDQAVEKKLDRSPEVMEALEAARREVLSRAYLEQVVASQAKVTPDEARAYYRQNPALFAERRLYNIQEIQLATADGLAAKLREQLNAGKSMEDIARWLKAQDIKFGGGSAARAAEQVPLPLLPKLHALKDGQGLVLEDGKAITVMRLVASQSQPVDEATALPRIQQFLGNQRGGEAAAREIKQLRDKATISYLGDFAPVAAAAAPAAAPASPAAAPVAAPAVSPAAAPTTVPATSPAAASSEKSATAPANALEKGVAGLK